jgi:hypothetical protein
MIYKNYAIVEEVFLGFKHLTKSNEIQVTRGVMDPKHFYTDQTVLVSADNVPAIWNLISEMAKLPSPIIERAPHIIPDLINSLPPKETLPEVLLETPLHVPANISLESQLKTMRAKEIVDKVLADTGQAITISIKSKAAILAKALKIYQERSNSGTNGQET